MRAIEAFLEVLAASGVTKIFGNPGTTELPLNDALADDPRFHYVFGIHEIPVVAMADGYAMAAGHCGVVNVHTACGLGNALGMLYNAFLEGTPLLLTAGQQDRRLRLEEPVLEGDLVSVARPWTKWAAEVHRAEDLPRITRRAIQTALTPPTGPVFLSLPLDVQLEVVEGLDLSGASFVDARTRPSRESIQRAASLLAAARSPAILAGSRVTEAHAAEQLAQLAELAGAPVLSECATSHGRLPIRSDHSHYAGLLPLWTSELRERLQSYDVVLAVGINLFRQYIYEDGESPLAASTQLIQLDDRPQEIAKNYPVQVGLLGDPRYALAELSDCLRPLLDQHAREAASRRSEQLALHRQEEQQAIQQRIRQTQEVRPLKPAVLIGAIAQALPPNAAVVEEAATTHNSLLEKLGVIRDPAALFSQRGWALGWGVGCALGVKLAWPDRPVLGLLGDGATLYGLQGLWTAAHEKLPVTFVICNNAQYKILKVTGGVISAENVASSRASGLDLVDPEIDFVALAASLGVPAVRLEDPDELLQRLRESFAGDGPLLIDVPIAR